MKQLEYKVIADFSSAMRYELLEDGVYFSERYQNFISVKKGDRFDGATGAIDIISNSWIYHDRICDNPYFDDGTPITAWQAAMILSDILKSEGRVFRSLTWRLSTFLFGCHKARENGYF